MTGSLALLSFGPTGWGDELVSGVWLTIRLALATLPLGLALGLGVALMRDSGSWAARAVGEAFSTVFRGLPELLTIFLVYFGAPRLVNHLVALAEQALGRPPSGYVAEIDAFLAGMLALSLVLGAFASEIFLGALRGVPKAQREAAQSLGMSPASAFRLVILPQVVRLALPGLGNSWTTLLKDTSLVSVIALPDLMRETNLAALTTRQHLLFYAVACLIYLALSSLSARIFERFEASAGRGFAEAGK